MQFKKLAVITTSVVIISLAVSTLLFDNTSIAIKNIDGFIAKSNIDKSSEQWKLDLAKPPIQTFDEGKSYTWKLETTEGIIDIQLMPKSAPMHVTSTIYLTRLGFYDDIVFHRVITDFMAQGGDPTGTGRSGPGYVYPGEFSGEFLHTQAGTLSMANSGPGTDGSQFFLTFKPTPWLDGRHTVFGRVVSDMQPLKALESFGSRSGKTSKELKIIKASIVVE